MGVLFDINNKNYQGIQLAPERCICGQVGARIICKRCKGYNADKWCPACETVKTMCTCGGEKG